MVIPITGWTHLILYAGMFILLLYLGYLLVVSPELTGKELGEKQQHLLVIMFLMVFAVFSLTRGVNLVAGYIGMHLIYNTASHFNNIQIQHTTAAYIGIIGVQSILKVAASVTGLKDIAGPLATIIGGFSNNILTIIISASIHKVLLVFGHRYAMSTLFPLGLVLLLIPVLRPAGSFLVAQAIVLWLILPVVIDSLYIPVGVFFGATSSPSVNSLMSVNSLNNITTLNQSLQSFSHSMLIGVGGGAAGLFYRWYLAEATLWIYLPLLGVILVEGSVVLLMGVLGGGGALKLIRKLVRYMVPILRM